MNEMVINILATLGKHGYTAGPLGEWGMCLFILVTALAASVIGVIVIMQNMSNDK